MSILPTTEKQGGPVQKGDWQKDMARRRYQKGSIRKRGKRNQVWELQWWEDYIKEDGSIARRRQSATLGPVSEMTLREARKLADERLRPVNQGRMLPQSTMELRVFVERYFDPLFFPTLKRSTQKRYRQTLNSHLLPAFGKFRLCDIGTVDLQQFVLQKMESGLGLGVCQPPPQFDVEDIRDGKEVELLSGEQPRNWGIAPREKPGPRKARASGKSDCASLVTAERACPYDGALRHIDGDANRRNSGFAPKGCKFLFRPYQNRTGVLSRFARLSKDQRQQTYSSLANRTRETPHAHMRKGDTNKGRGFGISNSKWHTLERHQLAASSFETSWGTTRDAVAELARSQTYPRHITSGGWGLTQRCPDTARSQQDVHDLGGLYHSHPGSSERSGRKSFAIGDQW